MSFAAEDYAELNGVLTAEIPWESYMTARLITERDLSLIRRFDNKTDEEVKQSMLDEVRWVPGCWHIISDTMLYLVKIQLQEQLLLADGDSQTAPDLRHARECYFTASQS